MIPQKVTMKSNMKCQSNGCWSGSRRRWPLTVFVVLYIPYGLGLFILAAWALDSGVEIPGIEPALLVDAFIYYFLFSLLHVYAVVLVLVLFFAKFDGNRLALAAIILPIVSLYLARALIVAHHPMMIYTW